MIDLFEIQAKVKAKKTHEQISITCTMYARAHIAGGQPFVFYHRQFGLCNLKRPLYPDYVICHCQIAKHFI